MQNDKDIKSNQENIHDSKDSLTHNYGLYALVLCISSIAFTGLYMIFNSCIFILIPVTATSAIILGLMALLDTKVKKGNIKSISIALAGTAIPVIWIATFIYFFIFPFIQEIQQQAQFFSIDSTIELFNSHFDYFPPSDGLDPNGKPYCGTMKLTEAVMGQDLKGFHPESAFRCDGMDPNGTRKLYTEKTLEIRKGPFIPVENATAYKLNELYEDTGPIEGDVYTLCDIYKKKCHSGKKIGMPILYYKADTSKTTHDINDPNNPDNIYNYKDNHALLALGVPGKPGVKHPMYEDPTIFYKMIKNYKVSTENRPIKADTFILLSAGKDGLYGTKDDLGNFDTDWKRIMAN